MTLSEFIKQKIDELKETGLYKDIELLSAVDVEMNRNCVREAFITKDSDLNKQCTEVTDFGKLSEGYKLGSKVIIDVLKKRKKTYDTIRYHVIYT
ncbi:hypothetical protein GCM10023310_69560 [Paenibacillus vulneris]|uniref:Uncharacterized protein n=1 Tax=Paenibacillus vulneris TaxID=1133364 RepID=A0ABW3UIL6_9BACL